MLAWTVFLPCLPGQPGTKTSPKNRVQADAHARGLLKHTAVKHGVPCRVCVLCRVGLFAVYTGYPNDFIHAARKVTRKKDVTGRGQQQYSVRLTLFRRLLLGEKKQETHLTRRFFRSLFFKKWTLFDRYPKLQALRGPLSRHQLTLRPHAEPLQAGQSSSARLPSQTLMTMVFMIYLALECLGSGSRGKKKGKNPYTTLDFILQNIRIMSNSALQFKIAFNPCKFVLVVHQ